MISAVTVDLNSLAVLMTPIAVAALAILQERSRRGIASDVRADKRDLDQKLEVIRVDVNSNLTKALTELAELKEHFGVIEGEPLPPRRS
jgi:hypothetical protein